MEEKTTEAMLEAASVSASEEKKEEKPVVPTLRVGSKTNVKALAGAITATIKDKGFVYLRAIGDGAIGRSVRASAIASGYLKLMGFDLVVIPSYFTTEINGEERTGVQMLCENR